MAADLSWTQAVAKLMCDAAVDAIDVGGAGTMEIYGDARPATTDTATSGQTLLAVLTFSATAFGAATTASPSVATAAAITPDAGANDTDTATWFRIKNGSGVAIFDGNVDTASADLILNTTAIVTGATVSCSAGTISMPVT